MLWHQGGRCALCLCFSRCTPSISTLILSQVSMLKGLQRPLDMQVAPSYADRAYNLRIPQFPKDSTVFPESSSVIHT